MRSEGRRRCREWGPRRLVARSCITRQPATRAGGGVAKAVRMAENKGRDKVSRPFAYVDEPSLAAEPSFGFGDAAVHTHHRDRAADGWQDKAVHDYAEHERLDEQHAGGDGDGVLLK